MTRWTIHNFDLVNSTNTLAADFVRKELAADTGIDGHVFVAVAQSAGRGQYERSFISPPGGLYATVVLEPVPEVLRPPLPLLVGIAVARALAAGEQRMAGAQIRWPNDLVIGGRKIAGILCEGIASGSRWIALAGIGINLSSDPAALPKSATTLLTVDGRRRDPAIVLAKILDELAPILAGRTDWIADFATLDALRGRNVSVTVDGRTLRGIAGGITSAGALLLATDSGRQEITRGSLLEIDGQRLHQTPVGQLPTR